MALIVVLRLAFTAFVRRDQRRAPDLDAPIARRTERALIAVIVITAMILRVAGWDRQLTPVFFPSARPMVFVAKMLEQGTLWPASAR